MNNSAPATLNPAQAKYRKQILSPFLFKLGMFKRLPSVWWWGIKVLALELSHCEVRIPFSWRTQNPFKSVYFSAQAGAAELSTGLLCQMALQGRGRWSMLVIAAQAKYLKKAKTAIVFKCHDGERLFQTIQAADEANEAKTLVMKSMGYDSEGVLVSEFDITWSFKRK